MEEEKESTFSSNKISLPVSDIIIIELPFFCVEMELLHRTFGFNCTFNI